MSENVRYRPAGPDVVSDAIDDGVVVLNLANGSYFTLDGVAREVWEGLLSGRSRDELVAGLARRYDAGTEQVGIDVDSFLGRLREEGLVVPSEEAAPRLSLEAIAAEGTLPFSPPVLVKYTDMEDLLNLDPIHEVDDSGWPVARTTEER